MTAALSGASTWCCTKTSILCTQRAVILLPVAALDTCSIGQPPISLFHLHHSFTKQRSPTAKATWSLSCTNAAVQNAAQQETSALC